MTPQISRLIRDIKFALEIGDVRLAQAYAIDLSVALAHEAKERPA